MSVLEVKDLKKSFDGKEVLKGVTFSVKKGEIVGLLGKNGCGKTTVLKIINDLLTIDSGEVLFLGEKIGVNSKSKISFLPERTYLDSNLRVREVIDYFKDFYQDFDEEKAIRLLEDLDLDINESLSKMSKGMKEKVQLALVMSRNASLYILDEPLGGVDPATRDYILKTILSNFNEGASMIITTHIIADVEKILDRVLIMDKGQIVLSGNADELREEENASINDVFRRLLK
jgi:ABC-2 type transport system ATP-binding protein